MLPQTTAPKFEPQGLSDVRAHTTQHGKLTTNTIMTLSSSSSSISSNNSKRQTTRVHNAIKRASIHTIVL